MRQIIFRAKCVQSGEWVEGDLIHGVNFKKDKMYILPLVENLAYIKHCDPIDGVEVVHETVSQFSGLLDMRSKKIFENQIVNDGNILLKCLFRNGAFNFYTKNGNMIKEVDTTWFEINGDIFENAEISILKTCR